MTETEHPEAGATTFGDFLEAVAAPTPAPAGGAAAGLSVAVGAALLTMVARYTTGEHYRQQEQEMLGHAEELQRLQHQALDAARADEFAFGAVAAAYGLPKGTEEERAARSAAIQQALIGATAIPLLVGEMCARLAELAAVLAARGHQAIVSDVAAGAACVAAGAEASLVNLLANAAVIRDEGVRARVADAAEELVVHRDALRALVDEIRDRMERRLA